MSNIPAMRTTPTQVPSSPSAWSRKYGPKFRFRRVSEFPAGIVPPRRVRIYLRAEHYLLQWWEPALKRNRAEPIDGDLANALVRARQIEERLDNFRSSGQGSRRQSHSELAAGFLADLKRRADAGEIDAATVPRYGSALKHYLAFCGQPEISRAYSHAADINRDFRLAFLAFLASRQIRSNGHPHTPLRPMKGQAFVADAVRAMLQWAADPERGRVLPDGFHNPFLQPAGFCTAVSRDPLAEPDITLSMAVDFVADCDRYQLLLFVPLLFFGLRASEPCFLFKEYLEDDWLRVPCNPDLAYQTKGRRDKRFPLLDSLRPFWDCLRAQCPHGLLYQRRSVWEGKEKAPLQELSLADLTQEFRRLCTRSKTLDAAGRKQLRDTLLSKAGGITYDQVQGEFEQRARRLGWPANATLKDFRHLFCTTLGNSPMPEAYRRYLMGHAPERAAIVAYTHLNQLRQQYAEVIQREWPKLLQAVIERLQVV